MEYRRLGGSGLRVSVLGLGGNTFGAAVDADEIGAIIDAALDHGINFFDTADFYSAGRSEELLGRALGERRAHVVTATKVRGQTGPGPNDRGASRLHIIAGVEASLRRLGTDYVDLLQLHAWDPETPIEETLGALEDLVRPGKVRYLGCSNYAAWQLIWALYRDPERELLPACRPFGVGVIPFFPLAAGMLTGKYREGQPPPEGSRGAHSEWFRERFMTPRNFAIVRRLDGWARMHDRTVAELAIAWLAAQPAVSTVITGVTSPAHVEANARAAVWTLTPAEAAEVAAMTDENR